MILFPRFHLIEIEDQAWCPSWLREYSHAALAQMWRTIGPFRKTSTASQACDVLIDNLPDAKSYTFVDCCAGAGGPTPILEHTLNQKLTAEGSPPVPFILADLYPDYAAWKRIVAKSDNITYVSSPVDATRATRYTQGTGRKECRMFNLCFHHFEDEPATAVLKSAVENADAIVIYEMTQRNFSALMNTTIVILSPIITTLLWFWYSPLHIVFTYLIPIVPLFFAIDGYVSCIRTRTPAEVEVLLKKSGVDSKGWQFKSGETLVLPPFGRLYWIIGSKRQD